MQRVILHSDANSFYASVEVLYHPELRGKPVAVCGDPEARHGIVLTKTPEAKRCGVKTAMAVWQARQVCPDLIVVPPDHRHYVHFSKLLQKIYAGLSDHVEPFGLDESWLDLSGPGRDMEYGRRAADALRARVREELGITVSVGVSFNKVFAKLGSDMKKRTDPPSSRPKIFAVRFGRSMCRSCFSSAHIPGGSWNAPEFIPSARWRTRIPRRCMRCWARTA